MARAALATGWIAARSALRPDPFYLGVLFVVLGLGLSVPLVRDTTLDWLAPWGSLPASPLLRV